MFTMTIRTSPEVLRALVPEPMVPNPENTLVVYIGMLNIAEPIVQPYGEAGIMIPVTLGERVGTFMPVLYLDEIELLISGREVWGFPKFGGEIIFKRDEKGVAASVRDGDVNIISASMSFEQQGEPIPVYQREHFLLKSIPSVTGDGFDIRQINTCLVRNDHRKEIWEGQADLSLASTVQNPLADIPVEEVISSVYTVGDIILDQGEMIFDYLA
ncbi:hypothetical protein BST96_08300 [Oceanicoccus sagamiensis]|uniref:Acetoacetate decarboxylase n=2 Tax=Oceanicoccus sagamiensis TaxID=716816 RepID=A0A1X9NCH1_9GAMM|nr:hypothetical protein BST96_08300 [Oceanicoccus sagamiensis]